MINKAVDHGEVMDATIPSCFTTAEQTNIDGVMQASIGPSTPPLPSLLQVEMVDYLGLPLSSTCLNDDDLSQIRSKAEGGN